MTTEIQQHLCICWRYRPRGEWIHLWISEDDNVTKLYETVAFLRWLQPHVTLGYWLCEMYNAITLLSPLNSHMQVKSLAGYVLHTLKPPSGCKSQDMPPISTHWEVNMQFLIFRINSFCYFSCFLIKLSGLSQKNSNKQALGGDLGARGAGSWQVKNKKSGSATVCRK